MLHSIAAWTFGLPLRGKLLLAATLVVLVELGFRRLAPRSAAYARWTAVFQAIGGFWTAIILGIVYFLSVAAVGLAFRLLGNDPLERRLGPDPSFWRRHEPNPLGPEAAARHQF